MQSQDPKLVCIPAGGPKLLQRWVYPPRAWGSRSGYHSVSLFVLSRSPRTTDGHPCPIGKAGRTCGVPRAEHTVLLHLTFPARAPISLMRRLRLRGIEPRHR